MRSNRNPNDALISYFKTLAGWTLTAISVVATAAAFFMWDSASDMRDEVERQKAELSDGFKELDQSMQAQKKEIRNEWYLLESSIKEDVDRTQESALSEIENVKYAATVTAENQAREKINEVFSNKNFDDFVEKMAIERIEPKMNEYVQRSMDDAKNADIEIAINNLLSEDQILLSKGITYFQTHIYESKLTDKQVLKLISGYYKVSDNFKYAFEGILMFQKSEYCKNFFSKLLNQDNQQSSRAALNFYIYNNIPFSEFEEDLSLSIHNNNERAYLYCYSLDITSSERHDYNMKLLNSKTLINMYLKNKAKQEIDNQRKLFFEKLKKHYSEQDIEATFFFKATV